MIEQGYKEGNEQTETNLKDQRITDELQPLEEQLSSLSQLSLWEAVEWHHLF